MDAALLRDEIIIESYVEERDAIGGVNNVWAKFAVVYARTKAVSANDRRASARIVPIEAYEWTIRWLEELDPKMRIKYRGKIFRIEGLIPYEDRAWITIMAEAVDQGQIV